MTNNPMWIFGQVLAIFVGAMVWVEHGMGAGMSTIFALQILIDIRGNTEK